MKILIGTDILLCYLLKSDYIDGISLLFKWLDKIHAEKVIDASSVAILTHFIPVSKFDQLRHFTLLTEIPKLSSKSNEMRKKIKELTFSEQKAAKTLLPHMIFVDTCEIDYLVTESLLTHAIAKKMNLDTKVYSIENFIEKCTVEYRDLDEAKGAVVKKCKFGELSLEDPFFKVFIEEYSPTFNDWFNRKRDDDVYISEAEDGSLKALLKLKYEFEDEDYADIYPSFRPAKRLKICSFKVDYNGEKIGERFLRIIFEEAIQNQVDEIYVTIFNTSKLRARLVSLIKKWGFVRWGFKDGNKKPKEEVYFRKMKRMIKDDINKSYPYHLKPKTSFIIPIHRIYSSQLLPEDTLINSNLDVMPCKHSIRKVLILHEYIEDMQKGSIIFFYRLSSFIAERNIIASGIIENVYTNFKNKEDFISRCRKRSILSDEELSDCWTRSNHSPIVVNFLYIHRFNAYDITTEKLKEIGIETNEMHSQIPVPISLGQYEKIIKDTKYERYTHINKT